jgi:hypothetical protein
MAVVGPPGGAGLRGLAEVAVVQAADFWKLHDRARRGELDEPELGCILVEREVCARLMVIGEVAGQDASQVSLAKDENVIQTFASDRTDQALRERVLPGAVRCRQDFIDLHTLHSVAKLLAIHLVTIVEEIGGRGVVRERVHDLLGGPSRGGILGDVEVNDMPAVVGEHDKNEEDAQAGRGHGEEIDRDQVPGMVGEERPPGLRGLGAPLRHQPGDGALGHVEAEFQELAMDARGAPEWIGRGHSCDQGLKLGVDGRAAPGGPAGERGPVCAEAAPLPPPDGVRGHDHEGLSPPGPDPGEPDPEEAVSCTKLGKVCRGC